MLKIIFVALFTFKLEKTFIILALHSLWSVMRGQWRSSPLGCAVGHTASFTANDALVSSQW